MFIIESLNITTKRRLSHALMILVLTNVSERMREAHYLIDSEIEWNFILQSWVKEHKLSKNHAILKQIQTIDDHWILCYDTYQINIELIDHKKVRKSWNTEFHAVNMQEYDMILDYLWLNKIDLNIRWRKCRWSYRENSTQRAKQIRVSLCKTLKFVELTMLAAKRRKETYVALLYQLLSTNDLLQNADHQTVRCNALQAKESEIFFAIQDLKKVFSEILSDSLNTHNQMKHFIDLMKSKMSCIESIYKMTRDELAAIQNYLDDTLEKKWIRSSSSSAEASVLFVKKLNESFRLCVNYRDLNEITVKNNYSLFLLSETLDCFAHKRHFIKIDICNVYHCIWICKSDEWKTTFHTRYNQFEYQMMLFELTNASAIFQFYVNHALKSFMNICCMIYLNDILVYSETKEQHWEHVCKILRALLKYQLYVKLSKCTFNRSEVIFLKFVIKRRDIQMKQSHINAITSWSELKSVKNILIFLKFARFYRQFIKEFFQIVTLLTDLIKSVKKKMMHSLFVMMSKVRKAFKRLKAVFVSALILKHYDWNADLCMKIDALNREVKDVLSQKSKIDQWHLIAYYSYKFKEAEVQWDMHDKELYAIVLNFKNWWHYLQSSKRFICMITDHNNLCYFMMMKKLNIQQMHWAEKLTAFDFHIKYRRDKLNSANVSSRRLDIMKSNDSEKNNDYFLSTLRNKLRNQKCQSELLENEEVSTAIKLAALTMQLNDIVIANTWIMCLNEKVLARSCRILDTALFRLLIHQIMKLKRFYLKMSESMTAWLLKLQQRNVFVANKKWCQQFASRKNEISKWSMRNDELLHRDLAVYVFNDFATRDEILRMNHDDFEADHFARAHIKTAIRRKYYWLKMLKEMMKYVRIYSDCQWVQVHHHKFYEKLMFISSESVNSFYIMIMNFITDMSSAKNSYIEKTSNAILIMIDKLIKHVIYISTIKDLNVERLANLLWWKFVSQHEMMRSIISNQDSLFINHFWITLCWHLEAKRKLSTAFHSQIDDQTERQNQMLEHYLRVYFNYKMNNWSELLSITTFAYNNSVHASIEKTSHELLKRYTASFAKTSENRVLKRKTFLTMKRAE